MPSPELTSASPAETAAVLGEVLAPLVAEGLIVRRPRVADALDRVDAQRRAIRRLERLRERHGPGPLIVSLPGRTIILTLDPADARRVLDGTPEPFSPATREKRSALDRFEPHGVLVSTGAERTERRRCNEELLETGVATHSLAPSFARIIRAEADALVQMTPGSGTMGWPDFARAWWRIVRQVVLGAGARDDERITGDLRDLRAEANWGPFWPRRAQLSRRFRAGLDRYVEQAEPGSLASRVRTASCAESADPTGQIPQWLFAFDAAGMAAFRALALLDSDAEVAARLDAELAAGADRTEPEAADADRPRDPSPLLRATVLESLRLWPTTPLILREVTTTTSWPHGELPAGSAVAIHVPYLHRDPRYVTAPDRFSPDRWLAVEPPTEVLMPFSLGAGECPGRDIVLLTTSLLLGELLRGRQLAQAHRRHLRAPGPLPATLSPFRLRFAPRAGAGATDQVARVQPG